MSKIKSLIDNTILSLEWKVQWTASDGRATCTAPGPRSECDELHEMLLNDGRKDACVPVRAASEWRAPSELPPCVRGDVTRNFSATTGAPRPSVVLSTGGRFIDHGLSVMWRDCIPSSWPTRRPRRLVDEARPAFLLD